MLSSVVILVISMVLAGFIRELGGSLFVYVQTLYAFFAPPFAAIFILGILFRRINAKGATVAVFAGFVLGIAVKVYIQFDPNHATWLEPYAIQAIVNWLFCVFLCVTVSLITDPPSPQQVSDELTINWRRLNIFQDLGNRWYTSVVVWWGVFAAAIIALMTMFSGLFY